MKVLKKILRLERGDDGPVLYEDGAFVINSVTFDSRIADLQDMGWKVQKWTRRHKWMWWASWTQKVALTKSV